MNKLTIVAVALVGTLMISACGSQEVETKEKVRPVKALTIGDYGDLAGKGYPGVTKEYQQSDISFRVGGPIVQYNVVEGARVNKGDIIAEIDPRDYNIELQSTQARYTQAKTESDRFYRLWQKGSVAKNAFDRRYASSLEAEAALNNAKNALEDTKLVAPYSGFYGPKLAQLGDKVRAREPITTLVDLSVLEVVTTIPEQLAIQLLNFESYEVRLETYPDVVFNATLKELEKKPTQEGFPLHLHLDHANKQKDNTQLKVSAGMSCRVNITLTKAQDEMNEIVVPLTAILEGQLDQNTVVWVINPDNNTVKKQNVVLGDLVGHDAVIITEGLSIGEQIVIAGVNRLAEGDKINNIDILASN